MQNSIASQKEIKTYFKKFEKISLVVHLLFSHAKHLLMKLLSQSLQTYAILLLGLLPVNYTPTRCVNPSPPVFMDVAKWFQKPLDSHLDETRVVALKLCSCLIFKKQNLIVKMRASTLQADRRKKSTLLWMSFVLFTKLCLKQWVAFIDFVPVKSCINLSLKKISIVAGEKTR